MFLVILTIAAIVATATATDVEKRAHSFHTGVVPQDCMECICQRKWEDMPCWHPVAVMAQRDFGAQDLWGAWGYAVRYSPPLVESGCKAIGCHFDVNSNSCGYFQIKEPYWIDCGRLGGDWHTCANDLECSSHCVQAYIQRYIGHSGCSHTCQSYARIHNGGPAGCSHSNTLSYWHLVQAKGCH